MPIFEYLCDECGTRFEKLVRRSGESNGLVCPSCASDQLKQQLSTFAAHGASAPSRAELPSCAGGMCRMPDVCGRN